MIWQVLTGILPTVAIRMIVANQARKITVNNVQGDSKHTNMLRWSRKFSPTWDLSFAVWLGVPFGYCEG